MFETLEVGGHYEEDSRVEVRTTTDTDILVKIKGESHAICYITNAQALKLSAWIQENVKKPQPKTIRDQFEALPVGTKFTPYPHTVDLAFIKTGDTSAVRIMNGVPTYYENVFIKGNWPHWTINTNKIELL